jgi:hypothetical protein
MKTCPVEGCGATLAPNNRAGFCQKHLSLAGPRPPSNGHAENSNGAAVAEKANGGGAPVVPIDAARASAAQQAADRVNMLLAAIPLDDKLRICSAWLAGKV